jgi:hypothetical protein
MHRTSFRGNKPAIGPALRRQFCFPLTDIALELERPPFRRAMAVHMACLILENSCPMGLGGIGKRLVKG